MSMIDNDWLPAIQGEFESRITGNYTHLCGRNTAEQWSTPPAEDIFNAFHFTPLSEVKVLLLGAGPLSQCKSGTWSFVFRAAGAKGDPALPAEHL